MSGIAEAFIPLQLSDRFPYMVTKSLVTRLLMAWRLLLASRPIAALAACGSFALVIALSAWNSCFLSLPWRAVVAVMRVCLVGL